MKFRLILAALVTALTACQINELPSDRPPAHVRLRSGDVIKITFAGTPELTQTQKIMADGKINLPLIDEITAAGKTIHGLQDELVDLYEPQLENNDVVVTLESGVVGVTITGYVARPGKLLFDRPTTIFQAIMEAGGASDYGNIAKVRLTRTMVGEQHTEILDLRSAMRWERTGASYVRDGDVIYVPQRLF
jgi:polysaccharide export outer membrane protein